MSIKLLTGAAFAAAVLVGAASAEAQSFQNLVETFYDGEFRSHPDILNQGNHRGQWLAVWMRTTRVKSQHGPRRER